MTFGVSAFGSTVYANIDDGSAVSTSAPFDVKWTVLVEIGLELRVNYEIRVAQASTLGIKYSILGGVASTLDISWSLGKEVAEELGVAWTISTTGVATISNNKFCVPNENRNKPFCV